MKNHVRSQSGCLGQLDNHDCEALKCMYLSWYSAWAEGISCYDILLYSLYERMHSYCSSLCDKLRLDGSVTKLCWLLDLQRSGKDFQGSASISFIDQIFYHSNVLATWYTKSKADMSVGACLCPEQLPANISRWTEQMNIKHFVLSLICGLK